MLDFKAMFGAVAVIIAFVGYVPYFIDIFKGKTKPHAFSWFVWGLLTGIAFFAQVVKQGGAGAWVTGFSSLVTSSIFVLALFKGNKSYVLFDWISLIAALVAMLLWWLTKDPLLSVILVTIVDAVGFLPTIRKGYLKPNEETISTFALSSIKFIFGIFALESFTFVNWLYPLSLVLMNGGFATLLFIRRKQLKL
jgi:hypothetical protein